MAGLADTVLEAATASGRVERVTPLGGQRYALRLPLSVAPDRVVADLVSQGAELVSVNPVHETLEDFYVRQIGAVQQDRGLGAG
jgi:hypothetical protein